MTVSAGYGSQVRPGAAPSERPPLHDVPGPAKAVLKSAAWQKPDAARAAVQRASMQALPQPASEQAAQRASLPELPERFQPASLPEWPERFQLASLPELPERFQRASLPERPERFQSASLPEQGRLQPAWRAEARPASTRA